MCEIVALPWRCPELNEWSMNGNFTYTFEQANGNGFVQKFHFFQKFQPTQEPGPRTINSTVVATTAVRCTGTRYVWAIKIECRARADGRARRASLAPPRAGGG